MNKAILISIAAAASLAAVAPALAQGFFPPAFDRPAPIVDARFAPDINQRIEFLSGRVDEAQSTGVIGWYAAQTLRGELRDVQRREAQDRFWNGGYLSGWQRMRLNESLDRVAAQLRF